MTREITTGRITAAGNRSTDGACRRGSHPTRSRAARVAGSSNCRWRPKRQIEAEICCEPQRLRVHVPDDGKGIEPEILKAGGRDGHWGLPGVRERAKRIGARLDFWSNVGSGTEVRVTVPALIACQAISEKEGEFVSKWSHNDPHLRHAGLR